MAIRQQLPSVRQLLVAVAVVAFYLLLTALLSIVFAGPASAA